MWGLWCAAALLLATELPVADRCAAAALALQLCARFGRGAARSRAAAWLYVPTGGARDWRLEEAGGRQALQLAAAGTLPGLGWLLHFRSGSGTTRIWLSRHHLDRRAARRLRAAITAGRT